jgi:hypothetical protein
VARFFDGLDLTDPGMVPIARWGQPGQARDSAGNGLAGYCGIASKP